VFYLFVGGLALNQSWYQWAEAIVCLSVGLVYLILGCACRTMADPGFGGEPTKLGDKGYSDPTTAGQVGADGKKQPDAILDLKKKAAHAVVEHAVEQHHNDDGGNPFA
jgi:hypothetical protein